MDGSSTIPNSFNLTAAEIISLFEQNSLDWQVREGKRLTDALIENGMIANDSIPSAQLRRNVGDFNSDHFCHISAHVTLTYRMQRRNWQMPIFYSVLKTTQPEWEFNK